MTTACDLMFPKPQQAIGTIQKRLDQLRILDLAVVAVAGLSVPSHQVAEAIVEFLQLPVDRIVFWAWEKHRMIHDARSRTRDRPGASETVVVTAHTFKWAQRPNVQADIGGNRVPILDLVLTLTLRIESVMITIAEGRIVRYGTGLASSTAELAVARPGSADAYPLVRHALPRFQLPGYVDLTPVAADFAPPLAGTRRA